MRNEKKPAVRLFVNSVSKFDIYIIDPLYIFYIGTFLKVIVQISKRMHLIIFARISFYSIIIFISIFFLQLFIFYTHISSLLIITIRIERMILY